jgi:alkanesulfonate monooxygenase SsuD/methylene tetrahydromethanopterin reductase-like flavin-dependent oxidoreductase (luciferase family)
MRERRLQWGLLLPQGTNLELGGLAPDAAWQVVADTAAAAERLGYDSVWVQDRTETLPRREPHPVFDGWSTLAALSQRVPRVGLGHLGLGAPLRDPAVLAKQAATLDVLSGGRMLLGLEADGYPSEQEAHGWLPPDPAGRRVGLTETVQVVRRLWTERRVSFDGKYVNLDRAFSFPKPLRRPPLLVVDEHPGQPGVPSVDPRHIDGMVWHAEPGRVRAAVQRFRERCEAAGVDPDGVEHTVLLECQIFDSERDRDRWLATPHVVIFWSEHPDLYMQRNVAGTVAGVRDRLAEYVAAGATQFLVWFRDYPDTRSVHQLMADVAPHLGPVASAERAGQPTAAAGAAR